jgi:hypothetical protein
MKSKDQQLLEEAYKGVLKEEYVSMSGFRSFHELPSNKQKTLTRIAHHFQIPNLVADQWVRDAMAAAYEYGVDEGYEKAQEQAEKVMH